MSINNTNYGTSSLNNNSGNDNSAFGAYAAYNNLDGSCNTAVGSNSLFYNTSGSYNTSLGAGSLCNNDVGSRNTAIGSSALEGIVANQSVGNRNTAIGAQALFSNTGDYNTGLGNCAALDVTTGNYNTFLGANTSFYNTSNTYEYSTALGYGAAITTSNQIMMGTTNTNVSIPGTAQFQVYNPTQYNDLSVVSKQYVDTIASGLTPSYSCICATTASINGGGIPSGAPPTTSTDGVTITNGDYVLVINQAGPDNTRTNNVNNGLWIVNLSGAWSRPATGSMSVGTSAVGDYNFVQDGTNYGSRALVQINKPAIVGTDPLQYTFFYQLNVGVGQGLNVTTQSGKQILSVDSSLNFINYLDNYAGPNAGTLNIGAYTTNVIIGPTGGNGKPVIVTNGITGPTGSFTNVSTNAISFPNNNVQINGSISQVGQGPNAVAVGNYAGQQVQGAYAVAVGQNAGQNSQGENSVAIGVNTGQTNQGISAVAIGQSAGQTNQGTNAVAIGFYAGNVSQGAYAVAIGNSAGQTNQPANSIVINANSASSLNGATQSAFYVAPVRSNNSNTAGNMLNYNTSTSEISYTSNVYYNNGNLGIGTTSPTAPLTIFANSNTNPSINGLYIYNQTNSANQHAICSMRVAGPNGGNAFTSYDVASETGWSSGVVNSDNSYRISNSWISLTSDSKLTILTNGNVGIGTTTPSFALDVSGNVGISGSITGASASFTNLSTNVISFPNNNVQINGSTSQVNQGANAVAIGNYAGQTNQGANAVAIGYVAGQLNQSANSVAIGYSSGCTNQSASSVAIGNSAGNANQGTNSVAIGINVGQFSQGASAVAIGPSAGQQVQGANAIAIGVNTGRTNQGTNAVAIGVNAGSISQGQSAVAIGELAGQTNQGTQSVAIGNSAGNVSQGANAVAIGQNAGQNSQGASSVALGYRAGRNSQGAQSVAIGENAGNVSQGGNAVAVGWYAGRNNQAGAAVAVGNLAGQNTQGANAVAVGNYSGLENQGANAVALGNNAGQTNQGANAVAIGNAAGQTNQPANSIVINASGNVLNGATQSAFYANPVRLNNSNTSGNMLNYNTSTSEISYTSNVYYNNGNLGIGTTSPSKPLEILGASGGLLKLVNSTSAYQGGQSNIEFWNNNSNYRLGQISAIDIATSPNAYQSALALSASYHTTGFVEGMRIVAQSASSAFVGIGTTTPTAPLSINTSSSIDPDKNGLYIYNQTNSANQHAICSMRVAGSSGGNAFTSYDIAAESGWSSGVVNSDNSYRISNSWSSLTSDSKLTILTNGNVGIGTTSPQYNLQVNGSIYYPGMICGWYADGTGMCYYVPCSMKGNLGDKDSNWYIMPGFKFSVFPNTDYGGTEVVMDNTTGTTIKNVAGSRNASSVKVYFKDGIQVTFTGLS